MSSITILVSRVILLDKNALESNELNIVQVGGCSSLGRDSAKSRDRLIFEIHQLCTQAQKNK